jgi:hypothetical protein
MDGAGYGEVSPSRSFFWANRYLSSIDTAFRNVAPSTPENIQKNETMF